MHLLGGAGDDRLDVDWRLLQLHHAARDARDVE
jgi:hypothetical protein